MDAKLVATVCAIVALAVVLAVVVVRARRASKPREIAVVTEQVVREAVQSRAKEREAVERKPPEVERLAGLVDGYRADTKQWDAIIAVGDVYRKGAFPRFLPNPSVALECFKVAARCPDGKIAGIGQQRYIEVHTDPIPAVDQAGGKLPTEYAERICELALAAISVLPYSAFQRPRHQKLPARAPEPVRTPDILQDILREIPAFTAVNAPRAKPEKYKYDPQNVHDHSVTKITKHNIDALGDAKAVPDGEARVKHAILEADVDARTKEAALHLIDTLGDAVHGTFGKSERDVLSAAWETIQRQDGVMRDNLVETLARQLASGIEHGVPVCSTGKITRIMSTFDGVEDIAGVEKVKPMWALRDELANLAARSRDEHDDADVAKREFAERARPENVERLGMGRAIIDQIVDEYSLGF